MAAQSIFVSNNAEVQGDVFYNKLNNNGTIAGSQNTPLALPVLSDVPAFVTGTPGTTNIVVKKGTTQTLTPGDYGTIHVRAGATLIFGDDGIFNVKSIRTGRDARLLFDGDAATEVRVQRSVVTGARTVIGPNTGAGIEASKIIFYVADTRLRSNAVYVGIDSQVTGNFYVSLTSPDRIFLDNRTTVTGGLFAPRVRLEPKVQVTFASFFGNEPPTATANSYTATEDTTNLTGNVISDDTGGGGQRRRRRSFFRHGGERQRQQCWRAVCAPLGGHADGQQHRRLHL